MPEARTARGLCYARVRAQVLREISRRQSFDEDMKADLRMAHENKRALYGAFVSPHMCKLQTRNLAGDTMQAWRLPWGQYLAAVVFWEGLRG